MINRDKAIFSIVAIFMLIFPVMSFGQNCYNYKNTTDNLIAKIEFNNRMHSDFFDSYEASYPWYVSKNEDGTFENAIGGEISEEDKIRVEYTSNCFSTHQGKHIMNFCDATYKSGVLQLEIYGGMPAYCSSLMITVDDSKFSCHFKAAYPAPVFGCHWNILSKKLTFKSPNFDKGKRIYAWVSVEFEETSTYKGESSTNRYKIEGYLKPVVK